MVKRISSIGIAAGFCLLCSLPIHADQRDTVKIDPARQRFVDRGDYVIDTKTKLLWQKDGAASGKMNFYDAAKYAQKLKLGGVTGWRVPTRKELASIFPAKDLPFQNSGYNPAKCCGGPREFRSYWTSELDVRLNDYAYVYHWYDKGGANNCFASRNFVYVRCVHDVVVPPLVVPPLDAATARRAKQLIAQLGDARFQVRESATAALKIISWRIEPLLKQSLQSSDNPETKFRIRYLLKTAKK